MSVEKKYSTSFPCSVGATKAGFLGRIFIGTAFFNGEHQKRIAHFIILNNLNQNL